MTNANLRTLTVSMTAALFSFAAQGSTFTTLTSLQSVGGATTAGVIKVGANLFGTGGPGDGTVYSLPVAGGTATALYSFAGPPDGSQPYNALVKLGSDFYGTTYQGGANSSLGGGTVFKIDASGVESVLHSFPDPSQPGDGLRPASVLLHAGPYLYGTTDYGFSGGGTVFKMSTSGQELWVCQLDGRGGWNGLVKIGTYLYGTTITGGTEGRGTVFRIRANGNCSTYGTLHDFTNSNDDGEEPGTGLTYVAPYLYGTTFSGGKTQESAFGTVFKIKPDGTGYSKIYTFGGPTAHDGSGPWGGALALNPNVPGFLFGTTTNGGTDNVHRYGTIFEIDMSSGAETILHAFSGADGEVPLAGLTYANGNIYGTTTGGGAFGAGTVFKFAP